MTKVLLGKLKDNNEACYLTKHEWSCGWYWSFGWLGNKDSHYHFSAFLKDSRLVSEVFETTNISKDAWWVIRDLFVQAYALQKAAEVYHRGGGQTSKLGTTDLVRDKDMVTRLNQDLEKVLDTLWAFVLEAIKEGK